MPRIDQDDLLGVSCNRLLGGGLLIFAGGPALFEPALDMDHHAFHIGYDVLTRDTRTEHDQRSIGSLTKSAIDDCVMARAVEGEMAIGCGIRDRDGGDMVCDLRMFLRPRAREARRSPKSLTRCSQKPTWLSWYAPRDLIRST